jgi:hypothetical protein
VNQGRTGFARLVELLPRRAFENAVERHGGEQRERRFSCMDQLLGMVFAPVTGRTRLRETVSCLRAIAPRRCHDLNKEPVSEPGAPSTGPRPLAWREGF